MGKSLQGWVEGVSLGNGPIADDIFVSILGSCQLDGGGSVSASGTRLLDDAPGHIVDFAGTIRKPYVKIRNYHGATAMTLTIRVNSVATSCVITVQPGDTGDILGTGEATFIADDYIDVVINMPEITAGDPTVIGGVWCEMETSGGHFGVYNSNYHPVVLGDIRTRDDLGGGAANIDYYATGITGTYTGSGGSAAGIALLVDPESPPPSVTAVFTTNQTIAAVCEQMIRVPGTFTSGRMRAITWNWTANPSEYGDTHRTATWSFRKNGADVTSLYFFDSEDVDAGTGAWMTATPNVTVVSGDLVCYSLANYTAPDAYDLDQPGPNIPGPTRQSGTILTRGMAMNFAATTDPENPLDIFIPVEWWWDFDGSARVPRLANATFYGPIAASVVTQFDGEVDNWNITIAELTMPTCTAIRGLRVNAAEVTAGSCRVTLIVDRHRTDEYVLVTGNGWTEYAGDDVIVPAGCKVCLQYTSTDFEGIIEVVALTQLNADGNAACIPCDNDEDGGGDDGDGGNPHGGVSCPDNTLTLAELREATLKMLAEDPDNPVYWSSDEIDRHINDAYVAMARDTKSLEYVEAVQLEEDSNAGTLSRNVGQVFRATWDDAKIENVTKWELDRTIPNWERTDGKITHYVTTLQDDRTITTYKTWDGSATNAHGPFMDGVYVYDLWADGEPYVEGARVYLPTPDADDAYTGYVSIEGHTANEAANKPGSGTDWETYWVPLSLMVWAVKIPTRMGDDEDIPEIRPWSHIGIAFLAAARALRKYGEMRNDALADAYEAIGGGYAAMLKGLVGRRAPERLTSMSRGTAPGLRPPMPWDQIVEEP